MSSVFNSKNIALNEKDGGIIGKRGTQNQGLLFELLQFQSLSDSFF